MHVMFLLTTCYFLNSNWLSHQHNTSEETQKLDTYVAKSFQLLGTSPLDSLTMGSAPGPYWRQSPQSPKVFPNTCYFPNLVCLDKKTWFLGAGSSWRGAASPYPPTRRSREGCKLPSGVRAEPGVKLICVHYLAGKWSFVVTILNFPAVSIILDASRKMSLSHNIVKSMQTVF